ncbi:MAG: hypothetical protein ACTSQP_08250 [Promethearchaeota archaeon]
MTENSINIPKKIDKKPQLRATIGKFEDFLLNKLANTIGKKRSEIERNIIEEWININSKKIEEILEINLNELRREFHVIYKDENDLNEYKEKLEKYKENIIEKLPKIFKNIKRISIKKLADHLNLTQNTLEKILFFFGDKITEGQKFNLKYEDGYIIILEPS